MDDGPTVSLPRRQLFELRDAGAARILCTAGCLWLTVDHDLRDVILEAGDSFEGAQAGRVLLYALEPSSFVLAAGASGARHRQVGPARRVLWRAPLLLHRP